MPRLIDLLAQQNWYNRFSLNPGLRHECYGVKASDTACFVVDNVADYYYYQNEKEYWCMADFPYPYPPFKHIWCEYKYPPKVRSTKVGTVEVYPITGDVSIPYYGAFLDADPEKEHWWKLAFSFFFVHPDGTVTLRKSDPRMDMADVYLSPQSEYINETKVPKYLTEDPATYLYLTHPMWMAFSLLNCRNVETIRVEIPVKLNRAREKRGNHPLRDFHMVNVLPMNVHKKVIRTVQLGPNLGSQIGDIKMRRGSFALYKDEDGHRLFGKYTGRYWRPAIQKAESRPYEVRVQNH